MLDFISSWPCILGCIATAILCVAFYAWLCRGCAPSTPVCPEGGLDLICEDPCVLPDGRTVCLKYNETAMACEVQILLTRASGACEEIRMTLDRPAMRDLQRDGFYHLDAFLLDYLTPTGLYSQCA